MADLQLGTNVAEEARLTSSQIETSLQGQIKALGALLQQEKERGDFQKQVGQFKM